MPARDVKLLYVTGQSQLRVPPPPPLDPDNRIFYNSSAPRTSNIANDDVWGDLATALHSCLRRPACVVLTCWNAFLVHGPGYAYLLRGAAAESNPPHA